MVPLAAVNTSPNRLLEIAVAAARAAGRHALENRHRCGEVLERGAHDVKLVLDRECQQKAADAVHAHWPGAPILGEEGAFGTGEWVWIIDPLDGTVNYLHGMPLWCTSVAVAHRGEVVAGAVFVPELNELYTATADGPAELNGSRIHTSNVRALSEALVLTGLSKHMSAHPEAASHLIALATRAQKTRVMGAAAVDLCNVACGRADGYYESSIYLWDVAAAGLIVERAGGRTEVLRRHNEHHLAFLATNGHIHEELKGVVLSGAQR